VIEFYSNKNSWHYASRSMVEIGTGDWYTCPIEKQTSGRLVWVGGKRAKAFLEKWK
jgi:hypothetical protein